MRTYHLRDDTALRRKLWSS